MLRIRIILFITAMLCSCHVHANETDKPNALFNEMTYDFGEIKGGSLIEHSFTVVNRGESVLEINAVKPDCGCTSSEFDSRIPPGKEGRITLKMDTSGYKGRIKKATRVFTNDPDKEMILLYIEGFIKLPILISKEYVVLKGVPGEVLTESIVITAEEDAPLKLEVVEYDLEDRVSFNMEDLENGRAYRLNFANKPGQSGVFSGELRLRTNYADRPEIEIKIRGRFVD